MLGRNEVLKSYSSLIASMWEDDTVLENLKAEPRKVLSGFGLDVPEDAEINLLIRAMDVDGSPGTLSDAWAKGEETGVFNIIVPTKPEGLDSINDLPLSEDVLEIVAGGQDLMAGCCSPCCPCCWDISLKEAGDL